jgi:single-stranded-DNA-specific exonuclease
MPEKRWHIPEPLPIPKDFQSAIGGHPIVAQTLYRRGYRTVKDAMALLHPESYEPTPADELPDSETAWDLLSDALRNRKRILVWGDFDVDGQTATATLVEGLRELGGNVIYHIPIREKESHGITEGVLRSYLEKGFDLLLTCDTGITEHKNIQFVRNAGLPVIVTDHHSLGESLPPANAVINPQRLPEDHPLRTLPGVGVAYKLMEGLFNRLGGHFDSNRAMELAALGIVADVALLQGDTRYLLQKGLESLRHTNRTGLQALYKNADLNPHHLNEDHIGFQIAPRLNAVGRLGDANPMVEFLTTVDEGRARILATQIEAMNIKRRFTTRQVEQGAEAMLQSSPEDRRAPAIILHHPDWPGGVVGIVASRLVERYQKPVILLTGEDPIHGSARSVDGVNITQAIGTQADLLTAYGGHPMAAGLSFPASNYETVKRGLHSAVEDQAKQIEIIPEIHINQTLNLKDINLDLIEQIQRISPFGPGNPPLNFMIQNLVLVSSTTVGAQGEHRQIIATDGEENQQRFIWWNGGDEPLPEAQFDLVCRLSKSDYKGEQQVSAEWVDFLLSEQGRQQVASRQFEWIDHRDALSPISLMSDLRKAYPNSQIWAEGELPEDIQGMTREELPETKTLIIWTAPPSQLILQETLRRVSPKTVIVIGVDSNLDDFNKLVRRIGGLAKYTLHHKDGRVQLSALTSACASTKETVRIGMQLWEAMGEIQVDFDEEDITISPSKATHDDDRVELLTQILKNLINEARAFRRFFRTADLKAVFDPNKGK